METTGCSHCCSATVSSKHTKSNLGSRNLRRVSNNRIKEEVMSRMRSQSCWRKELVVPSVAGTVNCSQVICAGLTVNDWTVFCGSDTIAVELPVINSIFIKPIQSQPHFVASEMRKSLIDTYV